MYKLVLVLLLVVVGNLGAMDTQENLQAERLCLAIRCGNKEEFNALLKSGVNPLIPWRYYVESDRNMRVCTPIMFAIMHHQLEMGKELLAKDANKQIVGIEGSGTLMEFAAMHGSYEFIPLLVLKGGKITDFVTRLASDPQYSSPEKSKKTLLILNRYAYKGSKGD